MVVEPWNVKGSDLRVAVCDDWHFATSRNAYVLYTYVLKFAPVTSHMLPTFTADTISEAREEQPICSAGAPSHRHLSLCSNYKPQCFQPYPTGQ